METYLSSIPGSAPSSQQAAFPSETTATPVACVTDWKSPMPYRHPRAKPASITAFGLAYRVALYDIAPHLPCSLPFEKTVTGPTTTDRGRPAKDPFVSKAPLEHDVRGLCALPGDGLVDEDCDQGADR
ncbi:uncharacterized protein SPSK_05681 [Sporothrix schenckii 1099-18]|uniref:Uncharacterized protein n=1 Tax=Sporothrix schenckii 1099-18 TaxID=1397361 RepID=A0A0F2LSD1_SPOSC|nr:uncharacterized protein SPSK_05681 [Sporothrix schenckii 1099-18]KJR80418.1 hypothetical protein SPSK_05681 [Sporothrix schenckii 1099-18]